MYGYIYLIVNKVNGKTYVGQKKFRNNLMRDWKTDNYMGSGKRLRSAKKHYGIENFEKFLIQYVNSYDEANEAEEFWIAEYRKRGKAEYNLADGGVKRVYWTAERRQKASEKMRERWTDPEYKQKFAEKMKGHPNYNTKGAWNKGKHLSEENKKKVSDGVKKLWEDEAYRKNQIETHKGHMVSADTKEKLSAALRGKKHSQEWTDKIMAKKREVMAAYKLDNKGLSWNEFQKAYSHKEDE